MTQMELARKGIITQHMKHVAGVDQVDENYICEEVAAGIRAKGGDAIVIPCHVAYKEQLQNLVDKTVAHWGGIDILVGNAGILVTQVLYTKNSGEKNFIVVDAGMNDLIRPSLYGSYQGIQPVSKKRGPKITADIVGPICESGDFLAKKRKVPAFAPGELMAVMSAGAYGFSMSSNYNSRPRVPEVLVTGETWFVIRERESYDDLIRGETIPGYLR